jgi:hypothetical protein
MGLGELEPGESITVTGTTSDTGAYVIVNVTMTTIVMLDNAWLRSLAISSDRLPVRDPNECAAEQFLEVGQLWTVRSGESTLTILVGSITPVSS